MIFESTPPRAQDSGDASDVATSHSRRAMMQPPSRATFASPISAYPLAAGLSPSGGATSPGDDGSPYETNSIKFADYFQQQDLGAPSQQQQQQHQPALLRQASSVVFDSHGIVAGGQQHPSSSMAASAVTLSEDFSTSLSSSFQQDPASTQQQQNVRSNHSQLVRSAAPSRGGGDVSPRNVASFHQHSFTSPPPALQRSDTSNSSFASPLKQLDRSAAAQTPQQAAQRDALRQIASELKERQAQLMQRELSCQRREDALVKRERALEESISRMQQEQSLAAEAAARKANEVDPRQEALDKALHAADEYRQQLRTLHKELSSRELEVDTLAQELSAEREKVAAQKLEIETRTAYLLAEEDDMNLDFKRHAERIQASSRLVGDRTREIERKEKELERIQFEWDLKEADLKRRVGEVQTREAIVEGKARDIQRVLDNSRSLELHAVQTQRIAERLRLREEALWATAAKVVPHGARAVAAIREDLRQHHQKLEDLGAHLPAVMKASAV